MLKELRVICALMLLISINVLPMRSEDLFLQERTFHEKLVGRDLIKYGTQAYYKKINHITSNPTAAADQWRINAVSVEGKRVRPTSNGVYMHGDVSFTIDPTIPFDPTEPLEISGMHGEKPIKARLANPTERKVPVLPAFTGLKDTLNAIRNNKLSLIRCATLRGFARIPGENPCVISIEGRNQCAQPITLRGMEIVCSKDEKKSKIFFDFVDKHNESVDHFNPIECDHSAVIADEKIVCIKDNRVYACTGKQIYGFFDSLETRKKWVPDESNFYDQMRHKLLSFPGCYSDPDDHQETLKQDVVWVFGDGHNSMYQLDGDEHLKDFNNYIYSNNGLFFATLPYKATYKECFSHSNKKELDYLIQVTKPEISIRNDVLIEEGNRKWFTGIYEIVCENDRTSWHRIGAVGEDVINFYDKVRTNTIFPVQPLDTQENKQWCDAAQRTFPCFVAKFNSFNQEIANGLRAWGNLTKLNVSDLRLENGLKWNDVFTSLGTMTQLTSLHFENNNPITSDLVFTDYLALADFVSGYYFSLAVCLNKLTQLKKLHIQGLWLKPHKFLGSGCDGWGLISTEVAILTGIINHEKQIGVTAIIQSICGLKHLESLSMDGIPNHGSADFFRQTYGDRFVLAPLWIITIPLQIWDGRCQDADLKKLVVASADQLAQMACLKNISVYSPGGNSVDYFSKAFRDRLAYKAPALSTLFVIAKELS